ncbi:hypothetical protein MMC28_003867 [Mycoblastus sanguinarius]|nr:hypothetical protein [Mycoblastus sanguinarius]
MEDEYTKNVHHSDDFDEWSVTSSNSGDSVMEPFSSCRLKIEQLLDNIGFQDFSIEFIQHRYDFMNYVYALTSLKDYTEQYVLRVAIDGSIRDSDGCHEMLEMTSLC